MYLRKFITSLSEIEKSELLRLLQEMGVKPIPVLDLTKLYDWLKHNRRNIPSRLFNNLMWCSRSQNNWNDDTLLSDVTKEKFLEIRNLGIATWQEFIELRGY